MIRTISLVALGWFLFDVTPITEWHFWAILACVFVAIMAED